MPPLVIVTPVTTPFVSVAVAVAVPLVPIPTPFVLAILTVGVVKYPCPPSDNVIADIVPATETVAVAKAGDISLGGWIFILFCASLP